jgi:hypothetical protein
VKKYSQPWLDSPGTDSVFILLPAVLPLLVIVLFPDYFSHQTEVTSVWWIVLVLAIDVAHVYSTLFRFYWNSAAFQKYKSHIFIIPVVGLVAGVILYSLGALIFWRFLAYLAVFHFVRQQYGFMRLYSRQEPFSHVNRWIDSITIYAATLYPLLYWHMYLTNDINWFIHDDFFSVPVVLAPYVKGLYGMIIVVYAAKEGIVFFKEGRFNVPKNAIVLGTFVSWYAGIIYFKGDLIFTMMNVVAHGIPYMALVYMYEKKAAAQTVVVPWKRIAVFMVTILVLAYFEEGIWDTLVWKDHEEVYPFLASFSKISSQTVLSVVVPLLTLPQFTHYVLDGFIWKMRKGG